MVDALCWTAATLLLTIGFALLALLQDRHRERVRGGARAGAQRAGPARHRRRAAGAVALIVGGLALCVAGEGAVYGVLAWTILVGVAALGVALCLAWWPGALRPLVRGPRRDPGA